MDIKPTFTDIREAKSLNAMLYQLSQELTMDELIKMKEHNNPKDNIQGAPLSQCKSPMDLLDLMSKRKLIDDQNTDFLGNILKDVGRVDLAESIKYWTNKHQSKKELGQTSNNSMPQSATAQSTLTKNPIQEDISSNKELLRRRWKSEENNYDQDINSFKINKTMRKAMDKLIYFGEKEKNIKMVEKLLTTFMDQAISEAEKHKDCLRERIKKIDKDIKEINDIYKLKFGILDTQLDTLQDYKSRVNENIRILTSGDPVDLMFTQKQQEENLEKILKEKVITNPKVNHHLEYIPGQDIADIKEGRVVEHKAVACKSVVKNIQREDNLLICLLVTHDSQGNEVKQGKADIAAKVIIEEDDIDADINDNKNGTYNIVFPLKKKGVEIKRLNISVFGQPVIKICPSPPLPLERARVSFIGKKDDKLDKNNSPKDPRGVAVSTGNEIYVGDYKNSKIQVYDTSGKNSRAFISSGDITDPRGLAFTKEDNLIIADGVSRQVYIYNTDGNLVNKFGEKELQNPFGVAIDSNDTYIHVADMGGNFVKTFTPKGDFVNQVGKHGDEPGELIDPISVIVNSKDQIIVSDYGNHRIQVFDSKGNFQFICGSLGKGEGELHYPRGVTVDQYDNIIVCDCYNNRIQMYDPNGIYIGRVDDHYDNITSPHSIAIVPGPLLKLIATELDNTSSYYMRVLQVNDKI